MEIRKTFKAEIAHRLINSYSVGCQSIHGHSYVFELILRSNDLDETGMLIDFGKVKDTKFREIIDAWDHSMIISAFDPMLPELRPLLEKFDCRHHVVDFNPTAEEMAIYLFRVARQLGLPVYAVRVHETLTGYAEYKGERVEAAFLRLPDGSTAIKLEEPTLW